MKKVLIPGIFDLFHIGHFNVLKLAKLQGDFLIVAIHKDSKNTKGVEIFYSPEIRAQIIKEFRFVDKVVFYENIDELVQEVDFDILCHGPDNTSELCLKAYDWCNKNNKKVVEIPRTPGVSSTDFRNYLKKKKFD